jgi:hypothetical protein
MHNMTIRLIVSLCSDIGTRAQRLHWTEARIIAIVCMPDLSALRKVSGISTHDATTCPHPGTRGDLDTSRRTLRMGKRWKTTNVVE